MEQDSDLGGNGGGGSGGSDSGVSEHQMEDQQYQDQTSVGLSQSQAVQPQQHASQLYYWPYPPQFITPAAPYVQLGSPDQAYVFQQQPVAPHIVVPAIVRPRNVSGGPGHAANQVFTLPAPQPLRVNGVQHYFAEGHHGLNGSYGQCQPTQQQQAHGTPVMDEYNNVSDLSLGSDAVMSSNLGRGAYDLHHEGGSKGTETVELESGLDHRNNVSMHGPAKQQGSADPRGRRSRRKKGTWTANEPCTYCKVTKKPAQVCQSHSMKNAANEVTCPALMQVICPWCLQTDTAAHTLQQCQDFKSYLTALTRKAAHGIMETNGNEIQ